MEQENKSTNYGINIDRMEIIPMGEERKLDLSKGLVELEGMPERTNDDLLDFPQRGLYSELIFGTSMDSKQGQLEKFQTSYPERMKRFGHIELNFPYVHPDLYGNNGSAIATLLGIASPKMLTKIIEWESLLVRVKVGSKTNDYLDSISGTSMDNFSGMMDIVAHYERKTNEDSYEMERPDGSIGMAHTRTHRYWHVPLKAIWERTESEYNHYKSLDYWTTLEDVEIFMGGFAVIHLLQQMDKNDEISFTWAALNARKEILKLSEGLTDSRINSEKTAIKKLSNRYQMLINYKQNKISWDALVSNIVLVMPAGLRDISIRKDDKGGIILMKAEINDRYVDILTRNDSLKGFANSSQQIMNILDEDKGDNSWSKTVSYRREVINNAKEIQRSINDISLVKITDKVGKKEGRFRQSILSKRMDYTARAVITPNPQLRLNEMGIPLYIIRKFMDDILKEISSQTSSIPREGVMNFLNNYNEVKRQIVTLEESNDIEESQLKFKEMTEVQNNNIKIIRKLEEILAEMRVLAIRFPTLHKYNAMGFKMKIVYDNTIHLHPLVCPPYNADFDGDQMSVYLIQTPEGVQEVDEILLPSKNLLSTSGDQLITPTQDAVLGSHYMTLKNDELTGPKNLEDMKTYHSFDEMFVAYETEKVGLNEMVEVYTPHYTESDYEERFQDFLNLMEVKSNREAYSGITFNEILENDSSMLLEKVVTFDEGLKRELEGKYVKSTVGRFIFNTAIPQDLGFVNREKDPYGLEIEKVIEDKTKKDSSIRGLTSGLIRDTLKQIVEQKPEEESIYVLDTVKEIGYQYATEIGISMSLQDIHSHPDKQEIIDTAQNVSLETKRKEDLGEISRDEAYEQNILTWSEANDELTDVTLGALPDSNTIKMMASSGSRGNRTQLAQLMGMRGLMADTDGHTIETPITSSFEDGLSQAEFFTASFGTRKGIYDRSNRTKDTGAATRTAVYGSEHLIISKGDCGDLEGIEIGDLRIPRSYETERDEETGRDIITPIYKVYTEEDGEGWEKKEKEEIQKSLSSRLVGKFSLEDIYGEDGEILVEKGMPIMKDYSELNKLYYGKTINVRSPITCKESLGICAKCYGFNFGSNRFAKIGDAVGTMAAQTIGEPGTQLTMRTFHTGGVANDGGITEGFDAVRKLLETKSYPEYLQMKLDSVAIGRTQDIEDTRESIVGNLEPYIKEHREYKEGITYHSYGIVYGDEYKKLMILLKEHLQLSYKTQGIDLKDVHYEVLARAMGTELEVIEQGDSIYPVNSIIGWPELESTNSKLISEGHRPVLVVPTVSSLKQVAMGTKSPLTAMTFQDLNKTLTQALTIEGVDHLTNPMSSVAVSNVLASGEGARSHLKRRERIVQNVITNKEFLEEIGVDFDEEELMKAVTERVEENLKPKTTVKPEEEKVKDTKRREITVEDMRRLREESGEKLDWGTDAESIVQSLAEDIKEEPVVIKEEIKNIPGEMEIETQENSDGETLTWINSKDLLEGKEIEEIEEVEDDDSEIDNLDWEPFGIEVDSILDSEEVNGIIEEEIEKELNIDFDGWGLDETEEDLGSYAFENEDTSEFEDLGWGFGEESDTEQEEEEVEEEKDEDVKGNLDEDFGNLGWD